MPASDSRFRIVMQTVGGLFADRKIGIKIAIGFLGVLAVTAAISAVAYVAFGTIAAALDTFVQRVTVVGLVRDVDRDFVAFRGHILEFRMTGDDNSFNAAQERRRAVAEAIENGLKQIRDADRRAKLEEMAGRFRVYGQEFDALVPLRREQIKLNDQVIEPAARKLLADLERLQIRSSAAAGMASEAIKHLLLARVSLDKLFGRYDRAAAVATGKELDDVDSTVAVLDGVIEGAEMRALCTEILDQVGKYRKAYLRVAEISEQLEHLLNGKMAEHVVALDRDTVAIKDGGVADQQVIEQATTALLANRRQFVLWLAIGGLAIGGVLAWLIGRAISRPLIGLVEGVQKLGDGHFDVVLPGLGRRDEVGGMAAAIESFKVKLAQKAQGEAEAKAEADRRAAEARRTADEREAARQRAAEEAAAAERRLAMHRLADEFETTVGSIVETVTSASSQLERAAGTLTRTAETTQHLSTAAGSASDEASSNVQSVASAAEEMSGSVHEISRQVQESSEIARQAVRQAQKTDARITELSQAANRIGDVVKLITAIAEQTNLLALNATIEAARAGEAGKGFAVVAQEVKALAAQTAKATGEIGTQISGMQAATNDSVLAIKEIGSTITRISQIAAMIAAAIEEQGAATQEITRNAQEAAKGTAEVATNIADVNRGASDTGSASTQVLASAQSLASESNHLQRELRKFLETVRAA